MSTVRQSIYQILKHLYGTKSARLAHMMPDAAIRDDVQLNTTPLGQNKTYERVLFCVNDQEVDGLRQTAFVLNGFMRSKDTLSVSQMKYQFISDLNQSVASPDEEELLIKNYEQLNSSGHSSDAEIWLKRTMGSVLDKMSSVAYRQWMAYVQSNDPTIVFNDQNMIIVASLLDEEKSQLMQRFIQSVTKKAVSVLFAKSDSLSIYVGATKVNLADGLSFNDSGQCVEAPYAYLGLPQLSPDTLIEKSESTAPFIAELCKQLLRPSQKELCVSINIADLEEVCRWDHLFSSGQKSTKQLDAVFSLSADVPYWIEFGTKDPLSISINNIRQVPELIGELKNCGIARLYPYAGAEFYVQLPLFDYVKDEGTTEWSIPLVHEGTAFETRNEPCIRFIPSLQFPRPGERQLNAQLVAFEKEYVSTSKYIRDPLSSAAISEQMNRVGNGSDIHQKVSESLSSWMTANGVNNHISLEYFSDQVTSIPYFISINLYRNGAKGMDCRNVSVFINSVNGHQITLSESAMSQTGLTPELLSRIGVSSDEADHLLRNAIKRASSYTDHECTIQLENASNAFRALSPFFPQLMHAIVDSPLIDSTTLIKSAELTRFPTYDVNIPCPDGTVAVFDDAIVSCSNFLLGSFLTDPSMTTLPSRDGGHVLIKEGEGTLRLKNVMDNSSFILPWDVRGLKIYGIQKSGTHRNRMNPTQAHDVLNRKRIIDLLRHFEPQMERNVVDFKCPEALEQNAHLKHHAHELNEWFRMFQESCDLSLSPEMLANQFIDSLPETMKSLSSTDLMDPRSQGMIYKKQLQSLHESSPLLFWVKQTQSSGKNLIECVNNSAMKAEKSDITLKLFDVVLFNVLRHSLKNKDLVGHYQQQSRYLQIAALLEPSSKTSNKQIVSLIAERFSMHEDAVALIYSQMYQYTKSDPLVEPFLPGRRQQIPLLRELMMKDWVFWSSWSERAQCLPLQQDFSPLLSQARDNAIRNKTNAWCERMMKPQYVNSRGSLTHRHNDGRTHYHIPRLADHEQHLSVAGTPEKLSLAYDRTVLRPTLNAAVHYLQMVNSLGVMLSSGKSDLSTSVAQKSTAREQLLQFLRRDDVQRPVHLLNDLLSKSGRSDLQIEDEGKWSSFIQAAVYSYLSQGKLISIPELPPSQLVDLRSNFERCIQYCGEISMHDHKRMNEWWNNAICLSRSEQWAHAILPLDLVISDATKSKTQHTAELRSLCNATSTLHSKQGVAKLLYDAIGTSVLQPIDVGHLMAWADDGKPAPKGSVVHALMHRLTEHYSHPSLFFPLNDACRALSSELLLKSSDPTSVAIDYCLRYPVLVSKSIDRQPELSKERKVSPKI